MNKVKTLMTSSVAKLLLVCVSCIAFLFFPKPQQAFGIGYLTVRVTNSFCTGYGSQWDYTDTDTAIKDTVPLEWWPPANLGGTLTHSGLQSAAVIVRSRLTFNRLHPSNTAYHYSSANWDSRAVPQPPFNSLCNDYVVNTRLNARNYSNSTYNSNLATDL